MSTARDGQPTPASQPAGQVGRLARRAALLGGLVFAIGVLLHPARDGAGVLAAGARYGLVHDLIAFGLVLQVLALVGLYASIGHTLGRAGWRAFVVALLGLVLWVALIVGDGMYNPVLARLDPALVHAADQGDRATAASLALLAVPALLAFPTGYASWARVLRRRGLVPGWAAALTTTGAVLYAVGGGVGILLFGPASAVVPIAEGVGAVALAIGGTRLAQAAPRPAPATRNGRRRSRRQPTRPYRWIHHRCAAERVTSGPLSSRSSPAPGRVGVRVEHARPHPGGSQLGDGVGVGRISRRGSADGGPGRARPCAAPRG
jgi:hypothetical protein